MAKSRLRDRIPTAWHPWLRPLWQRWKHRPGFLRSTEVDRPVFIVGHPRSGTSWLYKLVVMHPEFAGGPESHLFDYYLRPLLEEDPFLPWGGLDYWLDRSERTRLLRRVVDEIFTYRLAEEQKRRIVEKTPEHAVHVKHIQQLYPRARFVHIVRDGRDVMLSVFAYAEHLQDPPKDVAQAAEQWCRTLVCMDEAREENPGDVIEVRYEDLAQQPDVHLGRIFEFVGEGCPARLIEEMVRAYPPSKRSIGKWRSALGIDDQRTFSKVAGSSLRAKGYEV